MLFTDALGLCVDDLWENHMSVVVFSLIVLVVNTVVK